MLMAKPAPNWSLSPGKRQHGEATGPQSRARQRVSSARIEQIKQIGIFGAIPEACGDSPVCALCYAEVTEELSRAWTSLADAMSGHTLVAELMPPFSTEAQKQKNLPQVVTVSTAQSRALVINR
ncbi:acyl-CoA dehydrogenase family protein [Mycolicibacterium sp. XJ1819]